MSVEDSVDVTITIQSSGLTRAGFGTPMLVGYHTAFPDLSKTFGSLAELTAAGLGSTTPLGHMANQLLSQNPSISTFKIGKRTTAYTQIVRITPTLANAADADVGKVVSFTVRTAGGSDQTVSYTIAASDTVALQVDALKTAFDLLGLAVTSVDDTTHLTLTTDTAGALFYYGHVANCDQTDQTASVTLGTDLDAIVAADDDWYGLAIDTAAKNDISEAAAWAESKVKLHLATTGDSDCAKSGAGDIASALETASYHRTVPIYHEDPGDYAGVAWMGVMFAKDAGAASWKHKTLSGVEKDTLSTAQKSELKGKTCNYYIDVKGLGITTEGYASSGRFVDITRGSDELAARVEEDMFAYQASQDKVPFTDPGISAAKGILRGTLQGFVRRRFITQDFAITAPAAADVNATDKSNRLLDGLDFTATGQGAIHKFNIAGTVTF